MIIFRWCWRAITNIQTSWLLLIAGRVHSEKPSRQGDLQKGQPQHLWGKVGLQWFIENLKVLSETQILRWMGKTTSCTARTSASWPSCSSTTRPSTSTLSLSFSTFSARWTGSGCLKTLEPFKIFTPQIRLSHCGVLFERERKLRWKQCCLYSHLASLPGSMPSLFTLDFYYSA